jgi:uncharacterized OB-fold protein
MTETAPSDRPLPIATPDSTAFWEGCVSHKLILQQCSQCNAFRYPPAPACRDCGASRAEWVEVDAKGEIVNQSTMYRQLQPSFDVPYEVVVVQLSCGARLMSRLINAALPGEFVGKSVHVVWEDHPGSNVVLPLFELDDV